MDSSKQKLVNKLKEKGRQSILSPSIFRFAEDERLVLEHFDNIVDASVEKITCDKGEDITSDLRAIIMASTMLAYVVDDIIDEKGIEDVWKKATE